MKFALAKKASKKPVKKGKAPKNIPKKEQL
jgi:hypothetical protein